MRYDRKDTSYAAGKTYDREHHYCGYDGVWVTIETPQEAEEKES